MKRVAAIAGLLLGLMAGGANASFFGRNTMNQADPNCTVSGATKCTSFYNDTLDITIINDWGIGYGFWSFNNDYEGSAQLIAAEAGKAATGLSGWTLPKGNGFDEAGATNQYKSLWTEMGGTLLTASQHFDGIQGGRYWSQTHFYTRYAWAFYSSWSNNAYSARQSYDEVSYSGWAVAVRDGDVANVPLPATIVLLALGLVGIGAARRKQS